MTGRCSRFDRFLEAPPADEEAGARWRRHLAGCASCREQAAADASLRAALSSPPPAPAAGFRRRLRQRLAWQVARRPRRRPPRLRPAALWLLGAYGSAAAFLSVRLLSRLPWESIVAPPALLLGLAVLVLLSPLALLDRVGIVRPPGQL